jgi:hypothetical protein
MADEIPGQMAMAPSADDATAGPLQHWKPGPIAHDLPVLSRRTAASACAEVGSTLARLWCGSTAQVHVPAAPSF